MSALPKPERIEPEQRERVWGSRKLEPWFPNPEVQIGEVWFREEHSPVLVKFLFTTENLSVQVHPDDRLARLSGHPRGKTEMWHILEAAAGARIALGFVQPVTREQVRAAARDGSIMELLRWIPVQTGQTWFIPAGAVHAIGAGITLCEVQQNSDVTFRLFDYGRPRELHLEESLRAANLDYLPETIPLDRSRVVDCPYFQVDRIFLRDKDELAAVPGLERLVIACEGWGQIAGEPFRMGEVWKVESEKPVRLSGSGQLLSVVF